jgi:hypothetical protein
MDGFNGAGCTQNGTLRASVFVQETGLFVSVLRALSMLIQRILKIYFA